MVEGITFKLVSDEEIKKDIEEHDYYMKTYGVSKFDYELAKLPYGRTIKICLDILREECSKPLLLYDELIDKHMMNLNPTNPKKRLNDILEMAKNAKTDKQKMIEITNLFNDLNI